MPIHNFEVDPEEIKILKPVFIYMKQKKWLQPYNAPKFRMAFGIVNSLEFKKRIKNMSEREKKKVMFQLYRKYYMYFIDEHHLND